MLQKFLSSLIDPAEFGPVEKPPSKALDFFKYYLFPIRRLLATTMVLAGIATGTELLLYVYLGQIVDWMTTSQPRQFFEQYTPTLLLMLVVAALIRPLALLASRGLITFAITVGWGNTIRWHNHRYVVRQSLTYFQNDFAGRIAQKVMQTGNSARESVLNVIDGLWLLVIYLVGIIWLFLEMDWRLLIPVLLWALGYVLVISKLVPPVRKKSASLSEANSQWLGQVVDGYSNIQSVKLFATPELEDKHTGHYMQAHTNAFYALMGSIFTMTTALVVLNTLLIVGTAAVSIYLWQLGEVTVGAIAIANAIIMRINQMSGWILRTITSLFEHIGTVQNGIDTIAQDNDITDMDDAKALALTAGEIRYDQVGFAYNEGNSVMEDLNLTIRPSEKVGMVGRSGAGKSTLVNLLLRFHDVDSGEILIDGQNVAEVTQDSLRQQIAMVTQDTALLHRSVRDNIRYGRPDSTEEEVQRVAELAGVDQFIDQLVDPKGNRGFDALVGERGVKLSGGQRQRVAIARVILKNAPILILDEATSALDSEVEEAIQSRLTTLMEGKTVIAIAHRLSTIAAMDRLVVIDEGRIIEQGTHQELLDKQGLYAKLWQRQSGGFLGENE
uniref:Multidrug ABC transporter ATP-binding protein n=1 Tax=uncultured Thiotrichaceae bacterium TaxID=298394 RepID=A0A6S6T8W9_9GAMM|nr:MAG: Multidrug ABC transporter ATP-binding protein [uncultured Thiotrichaceae bacterium]